MAIQNNEIPVQSAYRQRLTEMLDLTYELEGLLHIGVSRSMVPNRLNHLIVNKLNAIVALADEPPAASETPTVEKHVEEKYHIQEPDPVPEAEEEDFETRAEEEFTAEEEVTPKVEHIDDSSYSSDESDYSDVSDADDFGYYEAEEKIGMSEDASTPAQAPKREVTSGGRIFSINDRFLYARELFGGRVADFDAAINTVITLDSPEEAEEYFISEWDFDPENPTAEEFLEKIKSIF